MIGIVFLTAALTFAQTQPRPRPDLRGEVDSGLLTVSLGGALAASMITLDCVSAGLCIEAAPVMKHVVKGVGLGWGLVIKMAVAVGTQYLVWRLPKGKFRTGLLAMLASVNMADALYDAWVVSR